AVRDVRFDPGGSTGDELRESGDWHGDIVLQTPAVESLRLGNRLAHLPHRLTLALASCERGIEDESLGQSIFQGFLDDGVEPVRGPGRGELAQNVPGIRL